MIVPMLMPMPTVSLQTVIVPLPRRMTPRQHCAGIGMLIIAVLGVGFAHGAGWLTALFGWGGIGCTVHRVGVPRTVYTNRSAGVRVAPGGDSPQWGSM